MTDSTQTIRRIKAIREVRAAIEKLETAIGEIDEPGLRLVVADIAESRASEFSQWLDRDAEIRGENADFVAGEHWGAENAALNMLRGDWV